jgi:hypothetical protein
MRHRETEPITRADLLYYQAESAVGLGELEQTAAALLECAQLTRQLGSRLSFRKLAETYERLRARYPHERRVAALGKTFRPWRKP